MSENNTINDTQNMQTVEEETQLDRDIRESALERLMMNGGDVDDIEDYLLKRFGGKSQDEIDRAKEAIDFIIEKRDELTDPENRQSYKDFTSKNDLIEELVYELNNIKDQDLERQRLQEQLTATEIEQSNIEQQIKDENEKLRQLRKEERQLKDEFYREFSELALELQNELDLDNFGEIDLNTLIKRVSINRDEADKKINQLTQDQTILETQLSELERELEIALNIEKEQQLNEELIALEEDERQLKIYIEKCRTNEELAVNEQEHIGSLNNKYS